MTEPVSRIQLAPKLDPETELNADELFDDFISLSTVEDENGNVSFFSDTNWVDTTEGNYTLPPERILLSSEDSADRVSSANILEAPYAGFGSEVAESDQNPDHFYDAQALIEHFYGKSLPIPLDLEGLTSKAEKKYFLDALTTEAIQIATGKKQNATFEDILNAVPTILERYDDPADQDAGDTDFDDVFQANKAVLPHVINPTDDSRSVTIDLDGSGTADAGETTITLKKDGTLEGLPVGATLGQPLDVTFGFKDTEELFAFLQGDTEADTKANIANFANESLKAQGLILEFPITADSITTAPGDAAALGTLLSDIQDGFATYLDGKPLFGTLDGDTDPALTEEGAIEAAEAAGITFDDGAIVTPNDEGGAEISGTVNGVDTEVVLSDSGDIQSATYTAGNTTVVKDATGGVTVTNLDDGAAIITFDDGAEVTTSADGHVTINGTVNGVDTEVGLSAQGERQFTTYTAGDTKVTENIVSIILQNGDEQTVFKSGTVTANTNGTLTISGTTTDDEDKTYTVDADGTVTNVTPAIDTSGGIVTDGVNGSKVLNIVGGDSASPIIRLHANGNVNHRSSDTTEDLIPLNLGIPLNQALGLKTAADIGEHLRGGGGTVTRSDLFNFINSSREAKGSEGLGRITGADFNRIVDAVGVPRETPSGGYTDTQINAILRQANQGTNGSSLGIFDLGTA